MINSSTTVYLLAGSLGVLLQICLKVNALKVQSKVANHSFSFKDYFRDDVFTILGSFITVIIGVICLDEIIGLNAGIEKYVKWFFVFVGFTGSSIIQSAFSVTSKKIQAIIDVKTNIADGVKPAVDATNIEGAKEIQKDKNNTDANVS